MHSDLLLLKHKNPNRSQQAPPGWFSQVNWFFPALLTWKHLPAVRKAPPSKTTNPAPLFPGRWPRTSYICLNNLSNITQRETHLTRSSSRKARSQPLCTRTMVATNTRPASLPAPCQEAACAGNSLFRQAWLQRTWGSQILATSHPRQMPKYGSASASLRSVGSQALSSHHCISSCSLRRVHLKTATPSPSPVPSPSRSLLSLWITGTFSLPHSCCNKEGYRQQNYLCWVTSWAEEKAYIQRQERFSRVARRWQISVLGEVCRPSAQMDLFHKDPSQLPRANS